MILVLLSPGSAAAATITVNSTGDVAAEDGACVLREAITAAVTETESGDGVGGAPECIAGTASDTIDFNIAGAGPHVIQPTSALPTLADGADSNTIDGLVTDPGPIELDGQNAGAGVTGLTLGAGTNTIRGLSVYGFSEDGIRTGGGTPDTIEDSFIGTDSAGTMGIGNGEHGIDNVQQDGLTIEDNVISGNGAAGPGHGVFIAGANIDGSVIKGNRIGTNPAGTVALPNNGDGIQLFGPGDDHMIGGTGPGEGNLISGNAGFGIRLHGGSTTGNTVSGNSIGTDAASTTSIPNGLAGLLLFNDVQDSTVDDNVISGNTQQGVDINAVTPGGNTLAGNLIGVGADGTTPIGNGQQGIRLSGGATGNLIGGAAPGAGNLIAHNGSADGGLEDGVALLAPMTANNPILGNSIHSNGNGVGDLGIDLADNGVSANDADDPDAGPNGLQNFPVINGAQANSVDTTVQGTLDSVASRTFRIEFFANPACDSPGGNGEGQTFLGAQNVTTDVNGDAQIAATVSPSTPGGELAATATDQTPTEENTSEFSVCVTIASKPEPPAPPPPPPPSFVPLVVPASNDFDLGKLKRNKKKGIAFLFVNVPGPGEVGLAGKGVKNVGIAKAAARKSVFTPGGVVKLRVKPGKGKAARKVARKLKNKGKAKLKVRVTFVPTGGVANTQARKVKLIRKR